MTLRRRAALETPRRAVRAAGLMALLATTMALPGVAAQAAVSDTALKAAFVFKFVRFTDWPARGTSTLTVCSLRSRTMRISTDPESFPEIMRETSPGEATSWPSIATMTSPA